ncbi:hypothetical protein BU16DRAFT_589291 [Lophium mytilinum]|uniref:Calcineurin-like phosphoesterase domain-containing protein n=1 Tax=Lophium mytilinum TaxID=390894 RepID=A0A6A6QQM3_9PEZI|nr:hypothetical protein BU16DRAFT_589291 [Lophium mytilinum]
MPPPLLPPAPLTLHVLSDLHLETPLPSHLYQTYNPLPGGWAGCTHLCLLGDTGLLAHAPLFTFLRRTLLHNPRLHILYVPGNHEFYDTSIPAGLTLLHAFAAEVAKDGEYGAGKRFWVLDRARVDIGAVTVLGCTLWSKVSAEEAGEVAGRMSDMRRIAGWDLGRWGEAHERDLAWLNGAVGEVEREERGRSVVVLMHHSPTTLPQAVDTRHAGGGMLSAYHTNLSTELCWTSPVVRLWAFGHTHFSCAFEEPLTGKLVFANQKGYAGHEGVGFDARRYVEFEEGKWVVKTSKARRRAGGGGSEENVENKKREDTRKSVEKKKNEKTSCCVS